MVPGAEVSGFVLSSVQVAALSFFLSHADFVDPQLRTPAWILGARPIMMLRDATFHSAGLKPFHGVKLTSDLATRHLSGLSGQRV